MLNINSNHNLWGYRKLLEEIDATTQETPIYVSQANVDAFVHKLEGLIQKSEEYATWFPTRNDFLDTLKYLKWRIKETRQKHLDAVRQSKRLSADMRNRKTA